MIKNYFKIAFRNIYKNRLYAIINCFGLYIGIFFFFLIGAYVWGEFHINREIKDSNRQYILVSKWKEKSMGLNFTTLAPLAKKLAEDYPNLVQNYYRFDGISALVSQEDLVARENIQLGDSSLLKMYGFKLLYGNPNIAFETPNSVVISKEVALKYFGEKNVVGKTLVVENFSKKKQNFTITGVLEKLPKSSVTHIQYENTVDSSLVAGMFMPIEANSFFERGKLTSWNNIYTPSFIKLKEGVQKEQLETVITAIIKNHTSDVIKENLEVIPVLLKDYYLEKEGGEAKRSVYILVLIGGFILLMATVNFVNISVSMMGNRMKEIGVRKVLGGKKGQLVFQFLSESFVLVLIAELLALGTFIGYSSFFSQLMGVEIISLSAISFWFVWVFFILLVSVSLLSGIYPAFVLSSLHIISSLKGERGMEKNKLQKTLVVVQFTIGLIIITASIIITQQIDFFFKKDLGYDKEYIITAQVPRDWSASGVKKMKVIRNEFEKLEVISNASLSYEIPNGYFGYNFSFLKKENPKNEIKIKSFAIDEHFFTTYAIHVFDTGEEINNRKNIVAINESAAKSLGWENPNDALGQKIRIKNQKKEYTIHQIVKDFHFDSMKNRIEPLVFFDVTALNHFRYLSFKIKSSEIEKSILTIEEKWKLFFPNTAFEFEFIDEVVKGMYTSEIRFKNSVYYASFISFFIVLLGVIGLVLINTQKRAKELAVRKVLGASLFSNIILFSKEMSVLVLLAFIIATPFTYYYINEWLNNYAYRVSISVYPFIVSVLFLWGLCIVLVTVLTVRVAKNTVLKSLKSE